jgi:hypothetical protein
MCRENVLGMLILLPMMSGALADDQRQSKPTTAAEQYKALLKEFQGVEEAFSKAYAAKSYEERRKFLNAGYEIRERLIPRFLELAEKNPKDVVAVDALLLVVKNSAMGPKDSPGTRALVLLRDHVQSDKLGSIFDTISFAINENAETFLRKVLERNPHKEVQAVACLSLAQFLINRLRVLDLIKDEPELAKQFETLTSKDHLKELQRQDRTKITQEAEALFEQAAEKYGDVKMPYGKVPTVAEKAKSELLQIRHLVIGKEAPDIAGVDQDGKPFKLSDYRGKVVLLDFWYQY